MAHSLLLTIITLIGAPLLAAAPVVTDAPAAQPPGTHMVLIPAGNFQMGKDGIATPVHTVFVSAFYMAKYEVTKELWNSVRAWGMAERRGYTDLGTGNGSYDFKGENHPVHSITWYDMVKWCNARSEMENLTPCYTVSGVTYKIGSYYTVVCNFGANGYRLPTEAEWEKAARGAASGKNFPWGTDTISQSQANYYSSSSYLYDVSPMLGNHPTYGRGSEPYSSPVGSFAPDPVYGLYDMAGNMWEWCWDRYGGYTAGSQTDPRGPKSGVYRVLRGGGWNGYADNCRVAYRYSDSPSFNYSYMGFRPARSADPYQSTLLGTFEGLIENEQGVPTGAVKFTITQSGAWSATLEQVGAARRSAKGVFLLDQQSDTLSINAIFAATKRLPSETVSIILDADSPSFSGTRADDTVRGFRIAKGVEMPLSGAMCNLALNPGTQDGIAAPAGIGWLTGKFGKTGSARFKGRLGDGTTASVSLRMSATGQALLWVQPYANKLSFLGGIVMLPELGQTTVSDERLDNSLWWSKAADAKTLSYPAGFAAMPIDVLAARWIVQANATSLGNALDWADGRIASLVIEGAGLSNAGLQGTFTAIPTELTLDDRFNLNATAPLGVPRVPWLGKTSKTYGKWTGALTLPSGFASGILAGKATASGVLLPGAEVSGCGYIKVPLLSPKGSFRTAAAILNN